jgi:site-specific recombinase XerD
MFPKQQIDGFEMYWRRRKPGSSTALHYASDVRIFFKWAEDQSPEDITVHNVDEFIGWQQDLGRAQATIRRRLIALRMFYDYLAYVCEEGVANPVITQRGALHPRSLQRRLVHYSRQCGVPVTAQRLRHTFASQMLTAGMPVSYLQRYLGHEHLDTTMIYAEVSDPLLRQDYYQGIATLDPGSEKLSLSGPGLTEQRTLRKWVEELKTPGLEQSRHVEILDIILANIS